MSKESVITLSLLREIKTGFNFHAEKLLPKKSGKIDLLLLRIANSIVKEREENLANIEKFKVFAIYVQGVH